MDINYKLLTPGPLSTSVSVKQAMQVDHCTWDDDYKRITQHIRAQLLQLAHVDEKTYTAVLMQGSGTFGVEAVLTSVIRPEEKSLVISNGAYGERIVKILTYANLPLACLSLPYSESVTLDSVVQKLREEPDIKHIIMVHCETTTGILNDIQSIGALAHQYQKNFIVDAMSSFGGIDIALADWHINYLISSANKCIQGVPGFSFVLAKREHLVKTQGLARSLSLDLYEQWQSMEKDGKWRFTSPTHTVLAFAQALEELAEEGGINARYQRYLSNNRLLRTELAKLGFHAYIAEELQSPFITSFLYPNEQFDFFKLYDFVKQRGFAIYPGKLMEIDSFRLGNIGEIYQEDVMKVVHIFQQFMHKGE